MPPKRKNIPDNQVDNPVTFEPESQSDSLEDGGHAETLDDAITLQFLHEQLLLLKEQVVLQPSRPFQAVTASTPNHQNHYKATESVTLESLHQEILSLQQQLPRYRPEAQVSRPRLPDLPRPPTFDGDVSMFRAWSAQVENYLRIYRQSFITDTLRVGLFTSLMTGPASAWLLPHIEANSPMLDNLELFLTALRQSFDDPNRRRSSVRALKALSQKDFPTFNQYETQFRLLSRDVDWSLSALADQFREGLNPDVDDYLSILEDCGAIASTSLEAVISASSRYVARRGDRHSSTLPPSHTAPSNSRPNPNGRPALAEPERKNNGTEKRCAYCKAEGHFIAKCTRRPQSPAINIASASKLNTTSSQYSGFLVPGRIRHSDASFSMEVLIDSGAGASFISDRIVRRYHIPKRALQQPIAICTFDGSSRSCSFISEFIDFEVCGKFSQHSFYILDRSRFDIILGLDWLRIFNPKIDWRAGVLDSDIFSTDTL